MSDRCTTAFLIDWCASGAQMTSMSSRGGHDCSHAARSSSGSASASCWAWAKSSELTSPSNWMDFTSDTSFAWSVLRIAWMHTSRASRCLSRLSEEKTSLPGVLMISNNVAQCMFSRGDVSLYRMAISCEVSTKNSLFTPGWPTSWHTALMSMAYSSSQENTSFARVPKWANIANNVCDTSTACDQLWNSGLVKYREATSSRNAAITSPVTGGTFCAAMVSTSATTAWRCAASSSNGLSNHVPMPNSCKEPQLPASTTQPPCPYDASEGSRRVSAAGAAPRYCKVCASCGLVTRTVISPKAASLATTRSSSAVSVAISLSTCSPAAALGAARSFTDFRAAERQLAICACMVSTRL
mmetsp:Transcript_6036/g.17879  ORF Transcript_6036/g.17879 Transcript_6036/m.17879 type:complete len:355 (+) Transcript_6036:329-1393(+)